MSSWIASSSRWLAVVAAVASVTACIATSSPRIRACAANGSATGSGQLRILPSGVTGVEIDSAYWTTYAGLEDIGTHEGLVHLARLRARRPVRRDELAILYDAHGPRPMVDLNPHSIDRRQDTAGSMSDDLFDLATGDTTTTARGQSVHSGFRVGKWSAFDYCPSTAQLVARNDLPFVLMPRLASDSVRRAAASSADAQRSPLVVVGDTSVDAHDGSALLGAAINVADTALTDMIVALVVVSREMNPARHEELTVEDTVEYHVGPVAPRGRVGFTGGMALGTTVVDRFTFPASRLTGSHLPSVEGAITSNDRRLRDAERLSDTERERARSREVLWTDATFYLARRQREVKPGVFEHELTIVARWTNPADAPLYLARCGVSGLPAYAIVHQLARPGTQSAYSLVPPCAGAASAIRVEGHGSRVDTLRFRAERTADLPAEKRLTEPRTEGRFLLEIEVMECDATAVNCRRAELPPFSRFDRSLPFEVRVDHRPIAE